MSAHNVGRRSVSQGMFVRRRVNILMNGVESVIMSAPAATTTRPSSFLLTTRC